MFRIVRTVGTRDNARDLEVRLGYWATGTAARSGLRQCATRPAPWFSLPAPYMTRTRRRAVPLPPGPLFFPPCALYSTHAGPGGPPPPALSYEAMMTDPAAEIARRRTF